MDMHIDPEQVIRALEADNVILKHLGVAVEFEDTGKVRPGDDSRVTVPTIRAGSDGGKDFIMALLTIATLELARKDFRPAYQELVNGMQVFEVDDLPDKVAETLRVQMLGRFGRALTAKLAIGGMREVMKGA